MAAIFPKLPNRPNTSFAACCPLSNSLPRERGREAVGIKGSARKISCAGCFLLFRRPAINGCKSKLLFKPPETAKSAAIRSLPGGGGLGRGHSPNFGNLSQHLNLPNTSLAACCPLSNSLPRERGRAAVGVKGCCKEKRLCSSLHVGCMRYARTRSLFSLQPQPTARVPCGTHPTDGFKGRLKKRSRRLFHVPCDKGYLKNSRC